MGIKADYFCFIREAHFQSKRHFGYADSSDTIGQTVTQVRPSLIVILQEIRGVVEEIVGKVPDVIGTNIVHTATRINQELTQGFLVENPLVKVFDVVVATNVAFPSSMDGSESKQPTAENIRSILRFDRLPIVGVASDGVRRHRVEDGFKYRGVHTIIDASVRFLRRKRGGTSTYKGLRFS